MHISFILLSFYTEFSVVTGKYSSRIETLRFNMVILSANFMIMEVKRSKIYYQDFFYRFPRKTFTKIKDLKHVLSQGMKLYDRKFFNSVGMKEIHHM